MTRQDVLDHIAKNLADVAESVGVAITDEPRTFQYVIFDVLNWANGDGKLLAGLTNYFAYRLFYAKQVTVGITPSDEFMTAMTGTVSWCENAGFDFAGRDE